MSVGTRWSTNTPFSLSLYLLISVIIQGCAATLVQTVDTQYVDRSFDANILAESGIALLPVSGAERVSRAVIAAAGDSMLYFVLPEIDFMDSKRVGRVIADNGIADAYLSFSRNLDDAGLLDSRFLDELFEATGKRYFVRLTTDRLVEGKNYAIEKNAWTGKNQLNSYGKKSIRVFGQIIDAEMGEVVWEGAGSANAAESKYFYIAQDEAEFYASATRTLIGGMFGVNASGARRFDADESWAIKKDEALPELDQEHRGLAYSVTKCENTPRCFYADVFEPRPLSPDAPYRGILYRKEYKTLDPNMALKYLIRDIDDYLGRPPAAQDEMESEWKNDVATMEREQEAEELESCSETDSRSTEGMVVIHPSTGVYASPRKDMPARLTLEPGAQVVLLKTKSRYSQVCFEGQKGWVEKDRLGRRSSK
ncbi:MAG: hypothetical protein R2834_01140 [Rhodothermales bacterium]